MRLFLKHGLTLVTVLGLLGAAGSEAQLASASPLYSSVVLGDNPIGYYRLGETPAQTIAVDSSPFGRNGTYVGNVTRGVPGAIVDDPNTAAAFGGGFVDIAGGPFNLANNFSLEAWVINNNTTGIARIVSNRQVTPFAAGYGLGVLADGRLRFTTFGIMDYDSTIVVPMDGNFHHVVLTFDSANTARFYLDGVLGQTIAGPAPAFSSQSPFNIGRNPVPSPLTGSFENWNGTLDEVAIYNSVLTAAQVQAHFQAGIASVIPEPSSLGLVGLGLAGLLVYGSKRRMRGK